MELSVKRRFSSDASAPLERSLHIALYDSGTLMGIYE